jgi:hypothetical protein
VLQPETSPDDRRDGHGEDRELLRGRIRWRVLSGTGLAILAAILLVVIALGGLAHVGGGSPASAGSNLPTGGLTRDQAVAKVREDFAGSEVTIGQLIWAASGPFAGVSNGLLAGAVKPTRLVWALRFDALSGPICPPDGAACLSSRPGVFTIFLDYYTGESLASGGSY